MNHLAFLHPATKKLARYQRRAKFLRMVERFRSPRRLMLSLLGVLLGILWIGQAAAGIILRDSADPENLKIWIPITLTAYTIWNVLKVTCRKPVEPFEWTEAEREWLIGAPLARSELVRYRFSSIVWAAVFKSAIFTLVMFPDLNVLMFGFVGMFCGLIAIDLIRLTLEVVVYGLQKHELRLLRFSVLSIAVASGLTAAAWAAFGSDVFRGLETAASLGFVMKLLAGFVQQADSWFGLILTTPFRLLSEIILAKQFSWPLLAGLGLACSAVWMFFRMLVTADQFLSLRRKAIECREFENVRQSASDRSTSRSIVSRLRKPGRWSGIGPLAWRQWIGARKYRISMSVALIVPFILSCLPAFSQSSGLLMFMNVIGGLSFYCFLLLPAAFKFDFRRDVARLAVLKSLPISPLGVVMGQLALPIALTTLFQLGVLGVTMLINPYHPSLLIIAVAILLPFNFCIFGYENLVFIWYPHRLNQEGIHVFLRSILAFTAKGLMFTLTLAGILIWLYASKVIAALVAPDSPHLVMQLVFMLGSCTVLFLVAVMLISMTARAFHQFDPTTDLAGLD